MKTRAPLNISDTRIAAAVAAHAADAAALSDDLAAHPELSQAEYESSKKIVAILDAAGFAVEYPYDGLDTAFRATLVNGVAKDPQVAFMVEYDALPDIGHGCGHNLHGALSVLAALACADLRDAFRGTVSVIGTPAEETVGGKITMADHGVFDGLAAALMMHSIGGGVCQPNMAALAMRHFTIDFTGTPAHAVASPWLGHSALAAARKCLDLIDARRECFTPDVRVNSIITDGGGAPNIISAHASLRVDFRAETPAKLALTGDIITKCAHGAALALDCSAAIRAAAPDYADMLRVGALETEAAALLRARGMTVAPVAPPLGSTDVGNVSYHCPALQPLIAITDEAYAWHTSEFAAATQQEAAYRSMRTGAEVLSALALRLFTDDAFRTAVYDEWKVQSGKR